MRTIRLNGELGKRYGRVHKLDVATPAEAIRALCANHPLLKKDLIESTGSGVGYKCVVDKSPVGEVELSYPMSRSFSITPVVTGAGKVGEIILGAALIFVAWEFAPEIMAGLGAGSAAVGTAWGASIGFMGLTYANVAWLGTAMVLGGVAGLLSPTPRMGNSNNTTNQNQYFNGPENTTAQGMPVPVGYGRMIVGSGVISASITITQQVTNSIGSTDLMINGFAIP